jgi:hypothetical protein
MRRSAAAHWATEHLRIAISARARSAQRPGPAWKIQTAFRPAGADRPAPGTSRWSDRRLHRVSHLDLGRAHRQTVHTAIASPRAFTANVAPPMSPRPEIETSSSHPAPAGGPVPRAHSAARTTANRHRTDRLRALTADNIPSVVAPGRVGIIGRKHPDVCVRMSGTPDPRMRREGQGD